ncbi:hypothetical protein BIV23_17210 [Streptomyces monashensis]|uniref:Uncharacterized protein n=1 Tax=Streptomyces monashensis TaxID=1678012 RepID=A0A1S2QGL2_9ACTN|nr:hypothetical protein BIV23_17210 [Streptomyces monashensis]
MREPEPSWGLACLGVVEEGLALGPEGLSLIELMEKLDETDMRWICLDCDRQLCRRSDAQFTRMGYVNSYLAS